MAEAVVAGRRFKSQKELYEHSRSIIEASGDGEMLSPEDSEFFLMLICERHRDPDTKILPGCESEIKGVKVRHESAGKVIHHGRRNHLVIAYTNGNEIDFSWVKCCKGFNKLAEINSALRLAVRPQVHGYKELRYLRGPVTCDKTGVPLAWEDAVVDHYPLTCAQLRDDWLSCEKLVINDIETERHSRGGCLMSNPKQLASWQQYHDAVSTLRLVTVEVNKRSWMEVQRTNGDDDGK